MEEIVFIPKYRGKQWPGFAALAVFIVASLVVTAVDPTARVMALLIAGFIAVLLVAGLLSLRYSQPYEVRFGEAIVLRRRHASDKRIRYRDITDIGIYRMKTRRGSFGWKHMENAEELDAIIQGLIEQGVIPAAQLAGDAYRDDTAGVYAFLVATATIPIFGVLAWLDVIPTAWIDRFPEWTQEAIFLLVIFAITSVAYLIIRYGWARMKANADDFSPPYDRSSAEDQD